MNYCVKVFLISMFFATFYGFCSGQVESTPVFKEKDAPFYVWVVRENAAGELRIIRAGADSLNLTYYKSEVESTKSFLGEIADDYGYGKREAAVFTDQNAFLLTDRGFQEQLKQKHYVQLVLGSSAAKILQKYHSRQAAQNEKILQRLTGCSQKKQKKQNVIR